VLSSWWSGRQSGSRQAAVEIVVAVLELAQASPDDSDQVVRIGGSTVGRGGAPHYRPVAGASTRRGASVEEDVAQCAGDVFR